MAPFIHAFERMNGADGSLLGGVRFAWDQIWLTRQSDPRRSHQLTVVRGAVMRINLSRLPAHLLPVVGENLHIPIAPTSQADPDELAASERAPVARVMPG